MRSIHHAFRPLAAALLALFAAVTLAHTDPAALLAVTWADLRFSTSPPKKIEIEGAKTPVESFNDQIPQKIRDLDGRTIEIRGYMMPTELEGKDVRTFVFVTSPAVCCYGQTPDINEYIIVRMTGKPAPLLENIPLRVVGTLHVGDIYDHGYWTGIYALDCSEVKL